MAQLVSFVIHCKRRKDTFWIFKRNWHNVGRQNVGNEESSCFDSEELQAFQVNIKAFRQTAKNRVLVSVQFNPSCSGDNGDEEAASQAAVELSSNLTPDEELGPLAGPAVLRRPQEPNQEAKLALHLVVAGPEDVLSRRPTDGSESGQR